MSEKEGTKPQIKLEGKELGDRANGIMDPVIETLKMEPRVLSALADNYFSYGGHDNSSPIYFTMTRGNTSFTILHRDDSVADVLREKSLTIWVLDLKTQKSDVVILRTMYNSIQGEGLRVVDGEIKVKYSFEDDAISSSEEAADEASKLLAPLLTPGS